MTWLLFIIFILLFITLDIKYQSNFIFLLYIGLFLLIGFRENLGWDYDVYRKFYDYPTLGLSGHFGQYFLYYISILKKINLTSQSLFFTITFFKIITIGYISTKLLKKYRTLPLFYYMINTFLFARDLGNLRQSISETFYLLFIYFFIIKKYKYAFLLQCGGLFHKSFFLANFYLINTRKKLTKKIRIKILFCTILLSYFFKDYFLKISEIILIKLLPKYIQYLYTNKFGNFYNLKTLGYIIPLTIISVITISCEDKVKLKIKNTFIILNNIYFFTIISLWAVSFLPSTISRIVYYPMQVYMFLLPLLMEESKINKKVKLYIKIITFILLVGFVVEFIFGENNKNSNRNRSLRFNFQLIQINK